MPSSLLFRLFICSLGLSCFAAVGQTPQPGAPLTEAQRINIALEALNRIDGNYSSNPELKQAVDNLLGKIEGTPEFVHIVKKFDIKDRATGLLKAAMNRPADESGVEAMRLLLAHGKTDLLKTTLANTNETSSAKTAEALGNTKDKRAVSLILPLVSDLKRDIVTRRIAVKALVQSQEGAEALLKLAKEDSLAPDLRLTASTELNAVRWAKVKAEAAEVLPLPQSHGSEPLPPIAELVKMSGDPANGEKIFYREQTACGSCHKVKDRGLEIGPNLTEIGSKLGKDALIEAILEPSAGISFGYEAVQLELKSGDEAYGLLASETEDEITIRDLKGIVSRYKLSDVAQRKQMKLSLMPAGLAATMTTQELVDLVDYLAGLKKAQ